MSLTGGAREGRVGVLDRAVRILDAVGEGHRTFTDIVGATGLPRPTAHRLLKALEGHGLLASIDGRRYGPGPHLMRLAATAAKDQPLRAVAHPVLEQLAERIGESAQLYVRRGDVRVCVDAVEATSELRTIVPVGATLPLTAGSAGKLFLAWSTEEDRDRLLRSMPRLTADTRGPDALRRELAEIRRRGWAASIGEREPGVASVSAPVHGPDGALAAAISVSGPYRRRGRFRPRSHAAALVAAARGIEESLGAGPAA
ncbi:MAG TPA: IclR family transcriptional regulator [Actinomycetota bacterium]|jgi:DNA-binding IclR family transcriptional regulator|nr:IclR family transcriptional regulator [Actinomycetota bacterium]